MLRRVFRLPNRIPPHLFCPEVGRRRPQDFRGEGSEFSCTWDLYNARYGPPKEGCNAAKVHVDLHRLSFIAFVSDQFPRHAIRAA
mmetsp:Transcript_145171/g.404553  ORF Transcript_145171/g.404553 Transcript_145171/m.404553 type:complete len:85 (-) Transcript_145171:592-846(-)